MQIEVKIEELRKKKLMIGTPAYSGVLSSPYHVSTIDLVNVFNKYKLQLKNCLLENESLITRGRNSIVSMFLNDSKDVYSHLLFIDSDIHFKSDDVLTLLALCDENQYSVISGSYPKKSINWSQISKAVKAGIETKELQQYMGDSVFNFVPTGDGKTQINLDAPIEVLDAGTGFMMIHRSVFEKMAKAYPEIKYIPDYRLKNRSFDQKADEGVHAFFDTMIVNSPDVGASADKKRYLSEDYAFCYRWREMGEKVWVAPWINLKHYGSTYFVGNPRATITLQSEEFANQQETEKVINENI